MIPAAAKDGLNLTSWRRSFPCIRSPFHEIWRYHVMCRICYSNLKLGILNNQDVLIGYRCFVPLALQSNGFEWSRIAWGDIPRTKRPECVFFPGTSGLLLNILISASTNLQHTIGTMPYHDEEYPGQPLWQSVLLFCCKGMIEGIMVILFFWLLVQVLFTKQLEGRVLKDTVGSQFFQIWNNYLLTDADVYFLRSLSNHSTCPYRLWRELFLTWFQCNWRGSKSTVLVLCKNAWNRR